MLNKIVDYALENVWAIPELDRAFLIEPNQVTDRHGVLNTLHLPYTQITMPTFGVRYVVYEVGAYLPDRLGIKGDLFDWVPLMKLTNDTGLLCQFMINHKLMNIDGIYVKRTPARNLIFAVPAERYKKWLDTPYEVFIRLYSNAYVSASYQTTPRKPKVVSIKVGQNNNLGEIFTEAYAYRAADKYPLYYLNGVHVAFLTPSEVSIGDNLMVIYDDTIVGYWETVLDVNNHYLSTEDNERRYVLHCAEEYRDQFRYKDDSDFYLMGVKAYNGGPGRQTGIVIPTFTNRSLRMLSHCDYAVETDLIEKMVNQNNTDISFPSKTVRVYVRSNDSHREIVRDGNLFSFLNQIPRETREDFISGDMALIPAWTAVELEKCAYTTFMQKPNSEISLIRNNPSLMSGVLSYFTVYEALEGKIGGTGTEYPLSAMHGCVLLFYTNEGLLHSVVQKDSFVSSGEIPFPPGAGLVEVIPGRLYSTHEEYTDRYDPEYDTVSTWEMEKRYYTSENGTIRRALEGPHYSVVDGDVVWDETVNAIPNVRKIRRRAGDVFYKRIGVTQIGEYDIPFTASLDPAELSISAVGIQLYLNGHRLIRDLDYKVQLIDRVPMAMLLNLEYFNPGEENLVELIYHGMDPNDESGYPMADIGWIKHGEVSRNNRFEFYIGTASKITIGGRLVPESDLRTAEFQRGELPSWIKDGMPYLIESRIQHYTPALASMLSSSRIETHEILDQCENILQTLLPEVPNDSPWIIGSKYGIVSPTMQKVISDLVDGRLVIDRQYNDMEVIRNMGTYADILDTDPATKEEPLNIIEFYPHSLATMQSVSPNAYHFLSAINRIYFFNKIRLNAGIQIGV